jgi:two-component sensor histidine kinase
MLPVFATKLPLVTLGLQLIASLTSQVGAQVEIERQDRTTFRITLSQREMHNSAEVSA